MAGARGAIGGRKGSIVSLGATHSIKPSPAGQTIANGRPGVGAQGAAAQGQAQARSTR